MSKPERPTTLRGAYPEWAKVEDADQKDCDTCEGYGWNLAESSSAELRHGLRFMRPARCESCLGTGIVQAEEVGS